MTTLPSAPRRIKLHQLGAARVGTRIVGIVGVAALLWLFAAPLVMLVAGSLRTSPYSAAAWTAAGFERAFTDSDTYSSLLRSIGFALLVTFVAMAIACYFAAVATRFDVRLRSLITPIMAAMLVFPGLLYVLGWSMVAAGDVGLLDKLVTAIGLDSLTGIDMRSWPGLILVAALKASSLAYFVMLGSFRSRSGSIEDAARVAGAGRLRTLLTIEIPLLTPALLAASFLVFIKTIEAFEAPAILGTPAGIEVFSTHLLGYLRGGLGPDYAAASAGSLVIVAVMASLVALQWRMTRGDISFTTITARGGLPTLHRPTNGPGLVTLSIVALLAVGVLLPLLQSFTAAFTPFLGSTDFTLETLKATAADPDVTAAIRTTIIVSFVGAVVAVGLALVVALAFLRMRSIAGRSIQLASWVPLGMPGLVLGLAFLWTVLATPGIDRLYGTVLVLGLGLGVATVPLATRTIEGALVQVPQELEDAARVAGARPGDALIGVTVRLVLPSLASAWLIVAIFMSGILDIPMILGTPSSQTVSQLAYLHYQNGAVGTAAAVYVLYLAAFVITLTVGAALWIALRLAHRRRQSRPLGGVASTDSSPTHTKALTTPEGDLT